MPEAPRSAHRIRVVVDADACVPAALLEALGIVCAPGAPAYAIEREPVPSLVREGGPFEAAAIAAVCAAAAEAGGAVLYIRAGDGHASPDAAVVAARALVEARGAAFAAVDTGGALMGAGWAAVVAAEAIAAGDTLEAAIAAAEGAARRSCVLALLEHPELIGAIVPGRDHAPGRLVVRLDGAALPLLGAFPLRDVALTLLRDRFGTLAAAPAEEGAASGGRLRVAVHHAGAAPGADALGRWAARRFPAAQVVVAPITRHAAARLGPGMIGVAWLWDGAWDGAAN
ncbi:MAG: hypothetical protein EXR64_04470 [Dehalococcoidia bacterium]|nr:hypothetical protein [Dehalococcoidia bacterium]